MRLRKGADPESLTAGRLYLVLGVRGCAVWAGGCGHRGASLGCGA